MVNRICVYAIAKNESHHVDGWYKSMKEADEIVVLDTGSTDDTVERLRKHGVYVEQKTYERFRFDHARNDSLHLVPEGYNILVTTDLDERFEPGWADVLRESWVEGKHTRAEYSACHCDLPLARTRNWIHDRTWTWMYPCHEAMSRESGIWYYPDETLYLQDRIVQRHYPDEHKSRKMYLDLLSLRYEENPDDRESFLYLLREYTYCGAWDRILHLSEEIRNNAYGYPPVEAGAAMVYLGDAYRENNDLGSAMSCYFEAMVRNPSGRAAYLKLARHLIDANKPEIAKAILLESLKHSDVEPDLVWCDTYDMWTWETYDWLCVACYWMGDYKDAIAYASLALKADPQNEHVKENLRLSLAKEVEHA